MMQRWTAHSFLILACWILWAASSFAHVPPISLSPSSCSLLVDAGPDTNVCYPGGTIGLMGSITGNAIFYQWTPSSGLSNPFILNPVANVTGPITYTLTAWGIDPGNPELVINGNFSAGNTGFSSDYNYVVDIPGYQMEMYPEGTYTVINNPNLVHNGFSACADHTTGTGNMMVVNGAPSFQNVWCQTIPVDPNSFYNVSAWVASVNPASPAQLQFSINGTPIGNIVYAPSSTCVWVPFNATWNSGSNTSATICILNLNTAAGGNDFAIDDISMVELCMVTDEVEITLYQEIAPDPVFSGPDFLCEGETGIYLATFPPDPPIYSYHWIVPGGATILTGQGTDQVTVLWNTPQETSLCLDIETRCDMNEACYDVTVGTVPEIPLITGGTELCPGESTTLYTPEQDPDDTYQWTLPPNVTLISGGGTNEIEIEWALAGEAEICVAVTNACGTTDNCTFLSLYPNYDVFLDTTICAGSTFFLNGHEYGNGILSGMEYFITSHGCDSIVEVTVTEASVLTYMVTENLCPGDSVFLAGAYQDQTGLYVDSFMTVSGCDSIILTQLNITPFDTTWLYTTTCDSTLDGIFVTDYASGNCDSTVVEQITYIPQDTTFIIGSTCNPLDTIHTLFHFSNQYGCDSVVITSINFLPSDTTALYFTSCDPNMVGVVTNHFTNIAGCDSLVIASTIFALADTTRIYRIVCAYADTGTVQLLLTNQHGCDSLVINQAVYGGSDTLFLNSASCAVQDSGWHFTMLHNHVGCDSIVATYTSLLQSDSIYINQITCQEQDTGVFVSHLLNQYGCDSVVTRVVRLDDVNRCHLEYFLEVDTPACFGDEVYIHLDLLVGEGPFLVTWTHDQQSGQTSFDTIGHYDWLWNGPPEAALVIASSNGLTIQASIGIPIPPPLDIDLQILQDYNGYGEPCYQDSVAEAAIQIIQPGTPPLMFKWSNSGQGETLVHLPAGLYAVTVSDSHGCEMSSSIQITEPPPLAFDLLSRDLSCFGDMDGLIQVDHLSGGVAPWMSALQHGTFGNQMAYSNLAAGDYLLSVIDQNGCELVDSVTLHEPDDWKIALGPDTIIPYGSSLTLSPDITGHPAGQLGLTWSDGLCTDCLSRTVAPLSAVTLGIIAQDENGCTSEDDIRIQVYLDRDLFIPNIFSPNGDQVNDVFLISTGPTVEEIVSLMIFDRWGDMVFSSTHFPPNDPLYAWDGTKDGQSLNPGVFVYQLEVRYIDGKTEDRYGDVTLIR